MWVAFPFEWLLQQPSSTPPRHRVSPFPFHPLSKLQKFGEALKPRQSRFAKAMSSGEKGSEENATRDASWRSSMRASAFWPQRPSKLYYVPDEKTIFSCSGSSTRRKLSPAGPLFTSEGQKRPTDRPESRETGSRQLSPHPSRAGARRHRHACLSKRLNLIGRRRHGG